jgi:predicted Holliday junction resolvase-like endonuclease
MLIDVHQIVSIALWLLVPIVIFGIGWLCGVFWVKEDTNKAAKKSLAFQRGILKGNISESLAPFLPGFRSDLKASEARFIGKPVDFLFFKGIDEQNISEVVFVEVKTGNSRLNDNERSLKDAIEQKRVSWWEYRVPAEATDL